VLLIVGYIYKISNIVNNKLYVGQTVQRIDQRFSKHISDAYAKKNQKGLLARAIVKHGESKFNIELLEEVDSGNLNVREIWWIEYLKSRYPDGYNISSGGYGNERFDYVEIRNLWVQGLGTTEIAEKVGCTRGHASKLLRGFGISAEAMQKRRTDLVAVVRICVRTRKILAWYNSLREAEIDIGGVGVDSHIKRVCDDQHKSVYGFFWRHTCDISEEDKLTGVYTGPWPSALYDIRDVKEAWDSGMSHQDIQIKFDIAADTLSRLLNELGVSHTERHSRSKRSQSHSVVCLNGLTEDFIESFESVAVAARLRNLVPSTIHRAVESTKPAYGCLWRKDTSLIPDYKFRKRYNIIPARKTLQLYCTVSAVEFCEIWETNTFSNTINFSEDRLSGDGVGTLLRIGLLQAMKSILFNEKDLTLREDKSDLFNKSLCFIDLL
jgi:CRP-like cAMP-binding protein